MKFMMNAVFFVLSEITKHFLQPLWVCMQCSTEGMNPQALTSEDTDMLGEICEHGIAGGFDGFIYHQDTAMFYDNNKQSIIEHIVCMSRECGCTASSLIAGFNCVYCGETEVEMFLLDIPDPDDEWETHLKNALSWWIAEEAARHLMGLIAS